MDYIKPNIKLVRTIEGFYLFDVNTNNIVEINETLYNYFDCIVKGIMDHKDISIDTKDINTVEKMKKDGLLTGVRKIEIEHSMTEFLEDMLNNELAHLCLQVTQNCNLRCEYCVFSGSYVNRVHSNKRMDWKVAKRAIDFLYEHSGNSDNEILIGFYGGEPILEIDLIKKCVEYAKKLFRDKDVQFNLTTNATLLNDEIIDYLFQSDFAITISLDGPEEVQDSHRVWIDGSGSFNKVVGNIEKMLAKRKYETSDKVILNSVLTDDVDLKSILYFFNNDSRVNQFTHQLSLVNDVNLVAEKEKGENNNREVREYEIFKAFLYGVGRIPKDMVSQMASSYVYSVVDGFYNRSIGEKQLNKAHPGGPCIPGQHKLFCDVEGNLYPCERVSETSEIMKMGNIYDGFDICAAKRILNVGKVTEDECIKCWAFDFCSQCIAFADGGDEVSREKRLKECGRVRNDVENMMKDYIILQKRGCEFEKFLNIKV